MAKKKKKQTIKINNKIKELMNGEPFDEGIKSLDENILIELTMILDLKVAMLTKKEMVRALRQVWSEGNTHVRLNIINYLEQLGLKPRKRNQELDKVEQIISLLSEHEHTKAEEQQILATFIDLHPNKINATKIKNRLTYLRQKAKVTYWEDQLNLTINSMSEMEFYHTYTFDLPDHSFRKSLLTYSSPIEPKILEDEDHEISRSKLLALQAEAIEKKEKEIQGFLAQTIQQKHRYLTPQEIEEMLRTMPPEDELYEIDIPLPTLQRIFQEIHPNYHIMTEGSYLYVHHAQHHLLYHQKLPYRTTATYTRRSIHQKIWRAEELPVLEDLQSMQAELTHSFENAIEALESHLMELAEGLEIERNIIEKYILQFIQPQVESTQSLQISPKVKRRIQYHFLEYIRPLKEKKRKEELLAKTIRDFKNLFPLARQQQRKIIFHVGPTNSGKTYEALNHLRQADTGYYLAPLRLLALEGYENLKAHNVPVSLITGEEEIIDEESTHISSTIEMMNASVDVEVAVIDEIQMINDRDRGWAWANALIGVPAKKVILTGSSDALEAVTQLCEYLQEPLEVVHFERKNALQLLPQATPLKKIEKGTAIVAFSRRDVLGLRQQLSDRYDVSVVYGNLSPEVRREEARRFREGESDVLVATDAIAMGLNLPIKTLLFSKDNKFDGLHRRKLLPTEVAQISGRAGRYGLEEVGYIGALDSKTLEHISSLFQSPLPKIELPFSVMASLEHVMLIGEILETENLSVILNFFADNMEFEGPFVAANIESMLEIASIVDEYNLDLKTRFHLACAPASISSPYIESVFHRYIKQLESNQPVTYIPPRDLPKYAQTNEMLLNAEDRVREISLYLWLSFKFGSLFPDTQKALMARHRLNSFIEASLQKGNFTKRCSRCGKMLDFTYRFSVCDACFNRRQRGNIDARRRRSTHGSSHRSRNRK